MKAVPAFVVSFALLGPLVSAAAASAVPNDASQVKPLQPGLQAPAFVARRPDGQAFNFDSRRLEKPVVMIFYRGGWCPYCNAHLGQLGEAEPELVRMGYEVLFLSADKPELLYPSLKDPSIKYTILSDAAMDAARAFGIAFRVDDATVAQYRQYGIDLDAPWSARVRWKGVEFSVPLFDRTTARFLLEEPATETEPTSLEPDLPDQSKPQE